MNSPPPNAEQADTAQQAVWQVQKMQQPQKTKTSFGRKSKMAASVFENFYKCVPPKTTAQQHKRIFRTKAGRLFLGTDAKGRATESELAAIFLSKQPPSSFPRDLPVSVELSFRYPYRKSEKKSVIKEGAPIPHTSKPDLDNLCKGTADVLTRCGFWNDDSQIFDIRLTKEYAASPGIRLKIITVD